jgi:hypothetical protein
VSEIYILLIIAISQNTDSKITEYAIGLNGLPEDEVQALMLN